MGLLRRLFGGQSVRQLDLNVTFLRGVRDDAALHVVGEAFRQANVAEARPPGPDDLPPGLPPPPGGYFKAMLIPEPQNQYDPHAIGVYLWAGGNWTQVGYLARGNAADFKPFFEHLIRKAGHRSVGLAADAVRVRERDGSGVVLHLGTPGECIADDVTEDLSPTTDHPWRGTSVVFTGQMMTTIDGVLIDRYAQHFLARWAGCEVMPRLTKQTRLLVVVDTSEATGNLQKAREYGVETIDERDYFARIGVPADALGIAVNRWARG